MRYWKKLSADKTINSVYECSFDTPIKDAIPIPKKEYEAFIGSLPPDTTETIDIPKEIEKIKERLTIAGL